MNIPLTVVGSGTSLRLPWPPRVNAYLMPIRCGSFLKMALTKKAREYWRDVADAIALQLGPGPRYPYAGPVRIDIELRPPDRRVRDLDGCLKSLLDSLTKCGVWIDDSLVDEMTVRRGQQIQHGRAIVLISPLDPPTE